MPNDYPQQLEAWKKARFAPAPEPELTPREPTQTLMVPMRDGISLYTEIFLPEGHDGGSLPVILMRSPYPYSRPSRNDKKPLSLYLEAGYVVVFQLTRGQYLSEGEFRMLRDDINDGYDCIEWLADQPWCNGRVGMEGGSYLGSTQLLAARVKPPALKCIMPSVHMGDFGNSFPYLYGIPLKGWWMQWHRIADTESMSNLDAIYGDRRLLEHPKWGPALNKRPLIDAADDILSGDKLQSWRDTLSHSTADDYWAPIHFTDKELAELDIPIFFTDGWYDLTIGPINYFSRLEQVSPNREDRYLLVGPWNHGQAATSSLHHMDVGDRKMPANGGKDLMAQRLNFFDRYLKENKEAMVQPDKVQVYITGLEEWRHYPTFPVPNTQAHKLYLASGGDAHAYPSDGQLSLAPVEDNPADHYIYDPTLPTPAPKMDIAEPIKEMREIEVRADVLTYTSAPLTEPMTILGEIELILHAASDCRDTDWIAFVTEVFPDGRSIPFHAPMGSIRARYREGFDKEVLLEPNQCYEYTLNLGPAGHQIPAGHRLRLSICSASFPNYDANSNTGNPVATDTDMCIASQTVYHDSVRASHLILPVIDSVTVDLPWRPG